MTHSPQLPAQQPQHPAAAYYPAPAYGPGPPKELTTLGVLAFATAALATLFTCVSASVVGRAIRHGAMADDIDTFDWSIAAYVLGSFLSSLALLAGWITGSMWLYRARRNAEVLEPGLTTREAPDGPGAAGSARSCRCGSPSRWCATCAERSCR